MTSVSLAEPTPFSGNPIDLVEEIVIANAWAHDRASEEELVVEISGRAGATIGSILSGRRRFARCTSPAALT